ncbi:hypothetical protein CRE_19821 [Caenorhabditis remanei]|uniref:Uncharacterized protein n=1 Tax=Caenorhabditis remanei TaxID=31234 RepID=E3MTG5_CAERE|nr:hypothetical protein CRE_19821 [Caenorhabditis remanei]
MNFLESYHDAATYQTVETLETTTPAPNNSTTVDLEMIFSYTNGVIVFAMLVVCAFVQLILFPFYIYVHHVNNKKDREQCCRVTVAKAVKARSSREVAE